MTADVVIIGAGIVGAACADALSRDGLRVTIIEPAMVGGGATAAGMGHLLVLDDNEAEFALTRYSRGLWNELASEMPAEVEYDPCGTLWAAADGEEMAAVHQKHAYYSSRGVRVETLDAKQLAGAEPNLRPGMAGGLLIRDDALIYSPRAALWFVERALARGAMLLRGKRVAQIMDYGVRLEDGTHVDAAKIVCASGSWATHLVSGLEIKPRKGHLVITDRYPGFVRHAVIELGYLKSAHGSATESVAFNAQPRKTGQILIGSSRQFGVTDTGINAHMLTRMLQRAIEYMPAIAHLSVLRTWAGFRAATPDKLPIIGRLPDRPNAYIATGHEGIGITTSLGSAMILRDLIAGRAPAIDPAPYAVERFA
ncbi:MAG: FAD-dependent oxidoreductase [Bryobacterales bacterium]|nr:FAD-dependent oxidoreductase [Bryobacterales bacterium]